jgi:hypothetical protein
MKFKNKSIKKNDKKPIQLGLTHQTHDLNHEIKTTS